MRRILQYLFRKPITWIANRFSSAPDRKAVFSSLDSLLNDIEKGKEKRGTVLTADWQHDKFIIFSDQHKGIRDGADDFRTAVNNYMTALRHYYDNAFTFINLGDCEELWENKPSPTIEANRSILLEEARFLAAGQYYRIFGNHDLEWKYEVPRKRFLKPLFGEKLKVAEALVLKGPHKDKEYTIFLAHGHQGDQKSDGNTFSLWVVAAIWTPIQRFLEIGINTISNSFELVDRHNIIMYEWSNTRNNLVFISGHTHKPVFASLDHIERLTRALEKAVEEKDTAATARIEAELQKRKREYAGKRFHKTMTTPSYFNTGCCCFNDGDITGIEIENGIIRLIKWKETQGVSQREILEECPLSYIFEELKG